MLKSYPADDARSVRQRRTHILKCDPEPFQAVLDGIKHAEVRCNDRQYAQGDLIELRETAATAQAIAAGAQLAYTGRCLAREITHVQTGYGMRDGFACLSIRAYQLPRRIVVLQKRVHPEVRAAAQAALTALREWPQPQGAPAPRIVIAGLDVASSDAAAWRSEVFDRIASEEGVEWGLSTADAARAQALVQERFVGGWPASIALGALVFDQASADACIPGALSAAAGRHYIDASALAGPLTLERIEWRAGHRVDILRRGYWSREGDHFLSARTVQLGEPRGFFHNFSDMPGNVEFVIGGFGSANCEPAWLRSLVDECVETQPPFVFAGWGATQRPAHELMIDGQSTFDGLLWN